MSNFSLFSFNSVKSSLSHINYEGKETEVLKRNWWRPEHYNAFDIHKNDKQTSSWCNMSKTCANYDRESLSSSEIKSEKVIFPICEKKSFWNEKPYVDTNQLSVSSRKGRELVLTLRPDQFDDDILKRFDELNYTVQISPLKNKPGSWVVLFPDRMMADRALAESDIIGYKFARKRRPRPSPRYPIMFKALHCLKIRSGKAFSRDVLGKVKKDDLVIVNQVKGRRARLVFVENAQISTLGWVSLHTSNGIQLLEQTDVTFDAFKLLYDGRRLS